MPPVSAATMNGPSECNNSVRECRGCTVADPQQKSAVAGKSSSSASCTPSTLKKSTDPETAAFLERLQQQIQLNLQSSTDAPCPMSKSDILELCQFSNKEAMEKDIASYGIVVKQLFHNTAPAVLYEQALRNEKLSFVSDQGALMVSSGAKTGRSPQDKRIVDEPSSKDHIWWGKINIPMPESAYQIIRERALDYLNIQEQLYVVDAFAGWDPKYRVKVRVITTRAYHALFMQNMLVPATREELLEFHPPDFIIYNAGCFPANRYTTGVSSPTSVTLHLGRGEMVILGTQYAGEMKKGILTLMMYKMPLCNTLPLHSSCNVSANGEVTLFFGLSGTGKTTLSADQRRRLVGDDEHVWTDTGVFNIEGGCYAKCKDLSRKNEPEIFDAIRFGTVLENVRFAEATRVPDYTDISVTENTRAAYPLQFIPNAVIPAVVDRHPNNIILLTCDAFGVLPPVSRLTPEQVMYHFIAGYTSKMAGTEVGVTEPSATFSSCYGAPFLALHPSVYADMLAKKLKEHSASAWLINTGWVAGAAGNTEGNGGYRCPLRYTRAIVDAIHDGTLNKPDVVYETTPVFSLAVPTVVPNVPKEVLIPSLCWKNTSNYHAQLTKLAKLFIENFKQYEDACSEEVRNAGPHVN